MLEKTTIQPTYNEGKKENDNRIVYGIKEIQWKKKHRVLTCLIKKANEMLTTSFRIFLVSERSE